jgi:hypothetical protein
MGKNQDPGSGSGIRDKHPGSATLLDTEAEVCNGAGEVSLDEDFLYVEWYLT